MAKKSPAQELGERLLITLGSQRAAGGDAYPLSPRTLAQVAARPLEEVSAALKKVKGRLALARADDVECPLALVEDADRLAGDTRLLSHLMELACAEAAPTCTPADLKKLVASKLRKPFEESIQRRLALSDWPAGVVVLAGKKPRLHLTRYALPKSPEEVLAETAIRELEACRGLGADRYPTTLANLFRADVSDALLKKVLTHPTFSNRTSCSASLSTKVRPADVLVAFSEDAAALFESDAALSSALRKACIGPKRCATVSDLKKQFPKDRQGAIEEMLARRVAERRLPRGVGCLSLKKDAWGFFFIEDIVAEPATTVNPAPVRHAIAHEVVREPVAAPEDFGHRFDEAFERLDRQRGGHNFVNLLALRQAIPIDRPTFDAGLRVLRLARRYTLSAAEGRHGLSPEERAAAVEEDGALLLHVSRRNAP